jgi:hypothetical protein
MTEQQPTDRENEWLFLLDPSWQSQDESAPPPVEAILGGWQLENGEATYFRPNPGYRPSTPDAPTDPADATLQLVARGEADGGQLLAVLGSSVLDIAVDEDGVALVVPSPDDVPSVLVTTAPAHQRQLTVSDWVEVTLVELADALPDEGIDVLLNPTAPCSLRLATKAIKQFVAERLGD